MALAMMISPLGQSRVSAFARVLLERPLALLSEASDKPFLCSAAMMSALCQSCFSISISFGGESEHGLQYQLMTTGEP